jgi:hypothetical protein
MKGDGMGGMGRHYQPSSLQEPFISVTGVPGPAAMGMAPAFAGSMYGFPPNGFGAAGELVREGELVRANLLNAYMCAHTHTFSTHSPHTHTHMRTYVF